MIFNRHRQTVPAGTDPGNAGILHDTAPTAPHPPRPLPPLGASSAAVLTARCVVVVTRSRDRGAGCAVTVLHPSLFPPEAMTDALFGIVRSASAEGRVCRAALVPSPCPAFLRAGGDLPFDESDACACASPLLWPSLSASPFPRPPAEGRLTCGGMEVPWPRGLVLGGSLPGEPFSLPKGGFCWNPLGWSP